MIGRGKLTAPIYLNTIKGFLVSYKLTTTQLVS